MRVCYHNANVPSQSKNCVNFTEVTLGRLASSLEFQLNMVMMSSISSYLHFWRDLSDELERAAIAKPIDPLIGLPFD